MKNALLRFQIILNKTLHADFIPLLSVQRLNKTHSWFHLPGSKKKIMSQKEKGGKINPRQGLQCSEFAHP